MKILGTYQKTNEIAEKRFAKTKRTTLIVAASLLAIIIFAITVAAAYDPGSDPLVTVSYLNAEKVKIKNEVEEDILSKLGFSSFTEMKNAIGNSGSGGTVNTDEIISQVKSSILSELGYSSFSSLKTAISTVSTSEKDSINSMVQSSILSQLGFSSMSALKAKINETVSLSDSDRQIIVDNVKAEMLKELGYSSFNSLKNAISNNSGNSGITEQEAVQYLLEKLGYDSLEQLKDALEKEPATSEPEPQLPVNTAGDYKTVSLRRGQTVIINSVCEAVLASGNIGVVGVYSSGGVTDITAGTIKETNSLLDVGHSYIIPVSDNAYALICASSEAILYVRGEYEVD